MTKVYYIVDKSKLQQFPFQVGKTYHQEWLQDHFEKTLWYRSCLLR